MALQGLAAKLLKKLAAKDYIKPLQLHMELSFLRAILVARAPSESQLRRLHNHAACAFAADHKWKAVERHLREVQGIKVHSSP